MSTLYTTFFSKSDFSFALLLVSFEPLEIQQSNIPLLKALKCGINAVGAQGRGCSSLLCHAHLKMGVLLHKQATVCSLMSMAVQSNTVQHSKFNSYDYSYSIIIFTVKSCSHYHQSFCAVPLQFLAGLHTDFYIKTNYS